MHEKSLKVKKQLLADPRMTVCIHNNADCQDQFGHKPGQPQYRVEWEHAFIYAGQQVQEAWARVGVCWFHHRGKGLNKEFNQYVSLKRAWEDGLAPFICDRYPRVNWIQKIKYLERKFENA